MTPQRRIKHPESLAYYLFRFRSIMGRFPDHEEVEAKFGRQARYPGHFDAWKPYDAVVSTPKMPPNVYQRFFEACLGVDIFIENARLGVNQ